MNFSQKVDYILTYYRLPLFTACVALAVLASTIYRNVTAKEPVVYLAYTNVVFGDDLYTQLTDGFISSAGYDPKKTEVLAYKDLYIDEDPASENHQFVYASKMKILGAISAKQMDIALMNDNAYDQLSSSGLLLKLDVLKETDPQLYAQLEPYFLTNTVILSDNSVEYNLNEASVYEAETTEETNGIDVSSFPVFRDAGIDGRLSLGIIANSTHIGNIAAYLGYLLGIQ